MAYYREIWAVDFEFYAPAGENPLPICMVAKELRSGSVLRLRHEELCQMTVCPFDTDDQSLVLAYYASAEMGCFLALGWTYPVNLLDLYVEYRNETNNLLAPGNAGLLSALRYYGHDSIEPREKAAMQQLAMRGFPYSINELQQLVDYCETDVMSLERLYFSMEASLDLPRATYRGEFMKVAAKIERAGIPIDLKTYGRLRRNWLGLQKLLIEDIDRKYRVFDGLAFKQNKFEQCLRDNEIVWPRLPSGATDLKDETFKEMARRFPFLNDLRELRVMLAQMRLFDLSIGSDGRNRFLSSAYQSKTSRSQPSNARAVFGNSAWLRHLIMPAEGSALAYIDWSQQEFGIAAALSGDLNMMNAYSSGDPYLEFAKQAGGVPAEATKITHANERELFKAAVLAVQYGMGDESLARSIQVDVCRAGELLRLHKVTYGRFWKWTEALLDHAALNGFLRSVFGWRINVGANPNYRSLTNFPMQANGAEMMRLACIYASKRGVAIACTIHDALLIEADDDEIDEAVRITQEAMADASAVLLNGFRLRSDVKLIRHPERYATERGRAMWQRIMHHLDYLEPVRAVTGTC